MEIKNIQLKVYQWYIKKGPLSIGIKGEKSNWVHFLKRREALCVIALFLLNMIE